MTCATVALFGAIPSLRASKPDVDTKLKDGRDTATSGAGQRRLRNVLATSELALAVVLVVGFGVAATKLRACCRMSIRDFSRTTCLPVGLMLPFTKYQKNEMRNEFYDEVMRRVRALPGVRDAGITTTIPLTNIIMMRTFQLEGQPDKQIQQTQPTFNESIGPRYLETLRVPLLAGTEFEELDSKTETNVVMVNQAFVKKFMDGDAKVAVGKRLRFGAGPGMNNPWQKIVGVAGDVRRARLDREADPIIYVPHGHAGPAEERGGNRVADRRRSAELGEGGARCGVGGRSGAAGV